MNHDIIFKRKGISPMKFILMFLAVSFIFLASSCQKLPNSVVGSDSDIEITGLTFTVTKTYISYSGMFAEGIVRYSGSTKISSPWFIEGQFYTDSTYTIKLGGSNVQINVPLESNQGTLWSLSLYPKQEIAQSYPKFKVGDLRGIYKSL
jgi:hypothetical protein